LSAPSRARGPQADCLTGTPADEIIQGLGGADTLEGGGGLDDLFGGGGNDRFLANSFSAEHLGRALGGCPKVDERRGAEGEVEEVRPGRLLLARSGGGQLG
jgi:hypothetical protein